MPTRTRAAVAVGDRKFTIAELPVPEVRDDDGLLRIEACGVCGSDLKKYRPATMRPAVLGHETVGRIERIGAAAAARWSVQEGDRVFLEEYLPCGACGYCRSGEFRSCRQTDNALPGSLRYGTTPIEVEPGLWGGYAEYQYLHPNTVLHKVSEAVPAEHVSFAIPLSNGIQWAQIDGGATLSSGVVVLGPGQQGIGCVLAAKAVGAEPVIVAGRHTDRQRLDIATAVGADLAVDVDAVDLREEVLRMTGGHLADLVIDTSGGGGTTFAQAMQLCRKGGTIVVASGSDGPSDGLDLTPLRKKQLTVRGVRGHSFLAVERALGLIATGHVPMDTVSGKPFGLADIAAAFDVAAGRTETSALHVTVTPAT